MGLAIRGKLMVIIGVIFLLGIIIFFLRNENRGSLRVVSPLGQKASGPLTRYSFENLRQRSYQANPITIDKIIKKGLNFTSYLFFYESDGKKISGLLNLPAGRQVCPSTGCPVIVLLRGYVDQEIYYTGLGTQKIGEAFAQNGYLTLAPDFIGYGSSDPQLSTDILEDRFSKPVEVLNLLASIPSLRANECERGNLCVNPNKIFLWGHSNGGQIALSVLEIYQKPLPTVLWAPVSKGFPEALTDYMHVLDDQGKKVKAAIDKFEENYDSGKYSITTYLKDINSPLQIHQGAGDDLVDVSWSDEFVSNLRSMGKKVEYFTYQGADHNLSGGKAEAGAFDSWQTAVSRSLDFFNKN